ncbi:MAG TPA: methyltransferase domain-containing protein, partial [Thermoleophilaceae bacterium]
MNTESTATQGDGPGGDDLRAGLRQMWNAVAPAWGEHAEYIDELASGMTGRMLDLTEPRPGEQVLELACGTGGLGMAAAERVAPGGEVVMSDVAAGMTAIARERADA